MMYQKTYWVELPLEVHPIGANFRFRWRGPIFRALGLIRGAWGNGGTRQGSYFYALGLKSETFWGEELP